VRVRAENLLHRYQHATRETRIQPNRSDLNQAGLIWAWGSRETPSLTSPLSSRIRRSTPCAAGCWGPKLTTRRQRLAFSDIEPVPLKLRCAADVPVKCLILASFLFEPSFKISSALNPCSLSKHQRGPSSQSHTQASQREIFAGVIAVRTHSSTECARTGAARPSGDGVASDRTAELEMARGEGTAVRAGKRERRGRRVRIMAVAVARGLPESDQS
jgi:hypothetical protein